MHAAASSCGVDFRPILFKQTVIPLLRGGSHEITKPQLQDDMTVGVKAEDDQTATHPFANYGPNPEHGREITPISISNLY